MNSTRTSILMYAKKHFAGFKLPHLLAEFKQEEHQEVASQLNLLIRDRLIRRLPDGRFRLTADGRRTLLAQAGRPGNGGGRGPIARRKGLIRSGGPSERGKWIEKRNAERRQSEAYARINIASDVQAGIETELVVGIASIAQANVVGGALTFDSGFPFELTIVVGLDKFAVRNGESTVIALTVNSKDHYPTRTLHLTAQQIDGDAEVETRKIVVFYSIGSRTAGFGSVDVRVHRSELPSKTFDLAKCDGAVFPVTDEGESPDLEIRIAAVELHAGAFSWSFSSSHFAQLPAVPKSIGSNASQFAANVIRQIDSVYGQDAKLRVAMMNGVAAEIHDAMPDEFDRALERLKEKLPAGAVPRVLIMTNEQFVPWELAAVLTTFDTEAPTFLGAQTAIARWILPSEGRGPGLPSSLLELTPMVEVTAVYTGTATPQLEHAEAEGKALQSLYGATHVDAEVSKIIDCLKHSKPPAKVLHLALHGKWSATNPTDGLIMVSGPNLTSTFVRGMSAPSRPFVFLNACQVGNGTQVLGQYSGLPAAFVNAKARAVIAPLWSIDDKLAEEIALNVYDRLSKGDEIATILRETRKRFGITAETTYLAYLLFAAPDAALMTTDEVEVLGATPHAST